MGPAMISKLESFNDIRYIQIHIHFIETLNFPAKIHRAEFFQHTIC